jgi:hypothetical protein
MSAGSAPPMMGERSRSRRDTLLLTGGATLTGAAVFVLIEAILSLVDELQGFDPAAYKVASGTDLVLQRDPALATGYRIQTAYPRP